jgi:hypothetical protein
LRWLVLLLLLFGRRNNTALDSTAAQCRPPQGNFYFI